MAQDDTEAEFWRGHEACKAKAPVRPNLLSQFIPIRDIYKDIRDSVPQPYVREYA